MEEVWKDISLNQDTPSRPPPLLYYHHAAAKAITLQEFLSGSFQAEVKADARPGTRHPAALLCPNSNSESLVAVNEDGFVPAHAGAEGNIAVDLRKKRMIKNRESATRSRARKQAYTTEMEKEVKHLLEENRKLKKKCDELLKPTMDAQMLVPKKKKLQRTASASF
ncbi:bZIP transcription factor 27 [Canna indica]|uniref:BZIP transcription factor 27 n=1 Tax=Canna indica TaxID=4628 RepID=A0AAQ3Q161_9LILI|nr:bZIP transcription factor 27 [Canna indica]